MILFIRKKDAPQLPFLGMGVTYFIWDLFCVFGGGKVSGQLNYSGVPKKSLSTAQIIPSWLFNYYIVHLLKVLLGAWTPYHKLPPSPSPFPPPELSIFISPSHSLSYILIQRPSIYFSLCVPITTQSPHPNTTPSTHLQNPACPPSSSSFSSS